MRSFYLHTHTLYSDGLLEPSELIKKASDIGLAGIAITDHDTVDAIDEAIRASESYDDFTVIPGIELSCIEKDEEVHILGYYIDHNCETLKQYLTQLKEERWIRGKKILMKLDSLGVKLPIADIIKESKLNNFIGRATIARNLIENGYVKSIPEAFDRFLDEGKPAFVERYKLGIEDAINLIHSIGGISVLAHPGLLKRIETVTFCIEKGIMGIECLHSKHSSDESDQFSRLCTERGLIQTGGSDYHGDEEILGTVTVDLDQLKDFRERLK